MKTFLIQREEDLGEVAESILSVISNYPVICFYGEMGAGKTTLIKRICGQMGVQDSMSSPTFSIVNEYRNEEDHPVYHFDFYRIEEIKEALDIGVEEYFYSGDVCLIEWPELINQLIPEKHLEINIKLVGDNDREITLVANG